MQDTLSSRLVDRPALEWLQALRGLAAFLVVLVHARGALTGSPLAEAVQEVLYHGAMGVDLFFILSGFLMVYTTRTLPGGVADARVFLLKRIVRIWPAYAVLTVLTFLTLQGVHGLVEPAGREALLKTLLFVPVDPYNPLYFSMALPVGWTLTFEMYFYLVFAAALLLGRWRWLGMAAWFGLTLLAVPMALGHFDWGVFDQAVIGQWAYANLAINPMVWDFLFGMVAAWLYFHLPGPPTPRGAALLVLLPLAALVALAVADVCSTHGPTQWGGPLALVFIGLAQSSKTQRLPTPRALLWLGEISYALYLAHPLAQHFLGLAVGRLAGTQATHGPAYLLLATGMSLVVGAWVWRHVEVPGSRLARRWLLPQRLAEAPPAIGPASS